MLDVKPLPLRNVNDCIVGCFQYFVSDTTTTELRMIVRLLLHVYLFLKHSQIKVSVVISQFYIVWSYRNHDQQLVILIIHPWFVFRIIVKRKVDQSAKNMAAPAAGSGSEGKISENPLFVSWVDSAWIPVLNQNNVLDYFSERTNPFYDRTCNNEILKMQKLGVADVQLTNMQVLPLFNSFVIFCDESWINKPLLLRAQSIVYFTFKSRSFTLSGNRSDIPRHRYLIASHQR